MTITITLLGVNGCQTCARLDEHVEAAIKAAGVSTIVKKVTTPEEIMEYNAGGLPAVFINNELMAVRRVPEVEELTAWLQERLI